MTVTNPTETLKAAAEIKGMSGVSSAEPKIAQIMQKRAVPNDPLFPQQWHLENTGQNGGLPGVDLNVLTVWDDYRGNNQVIGIVDDGLERNHEDLGSAYVPAFQFGPGRAYVPDSRHKQYPGNFLHRDSEGLGAMMF